MAQLEQQHHLQSAQAAQAGLGEQHQLQAAQAAQNRVAQLEQLEQQLSNLGHPGLGGMQGGLTLRCGLQLLL